MAIVTFAAKVGQAITGDGHVVTHGGLTDATLSGISSITGADVVILINNVNVVSKNQLRAVLAEMVARATSSKSFT